MKKFISIVVIIVFLFSSAIFLARFFLCQPILDHLEKRFEKKWGCQVTKRKADFSFLKGSLRFKEIHIMTPENAVSGWNLNADEIFIQIDYPSLIGGNTILDKLTLGKVIFRQSKTEGLDIKKKDMQPRIIKKEAERNHFEKKRPFPRSPRKAILVRYFLIRDGYFEFYYSENSGKKGMLKLEHVNLSKKDVLLGRKLDVFFRSLFEGFERFGKSLI